MLSESETDGDSASGDGDGGKAHWSITTTCQIGFGAGVVHL